MKNLSDINVVKSLLSRHGFQFSKALGQNFLINPEICPKMATGSNRGWSRLWRINQRIGSKGQ